MTLPTFLPKWLTSATNSATASSFFSSPLKRRPPSTTTNAAKKENLSMEGQENRRLLCFAAVLIGNLLAIACLLVVWNANAITNALVMTDSSVINLSDMEQEEEEIQLAKQPRKLNSYTAAYKLETIKHAKHISIHYASKKCHVDHNTLRAWIKNETKQQKNVTWAVLIIGVATGMSILCCALFLLICFGSGGSSDGSVLKNICSCCLVNHQKRVGYGQSALPKMLPKLGGLKANRREAAMVYRIQTVCPTPEFQYFGNATPVLITASSGTTTRLPTTTDSLTNQSTKSQSQLSAFSLTSTAPASSPPPTRHTLSDKEKTNNLTFYPFTGAYISTPRLDPTSPIIQFPPATTYGLMDSSLSLTPIATSSSDMGLIRGGQQIRSTAVETNPYMSMYSGV